MIPYYFIYLILIFKAVSFKKLPAYQKNTIEFRTAYQESKYRKALQYYNLMLSEHQLINLELHLNAAHSYFYLDDFENANVLYKKLNNSKKYASSSYLQQGIIAINKKDTLSAIKLFRESLNQDPNNKKAAFNYELIKKQYFQKNNKQKAIKLQKLMGFEEENQESPEKIEELKPYQQEPFSREKAIQLLDMQREREKKIRVLNKNLKKITDENW